MSGNWVYIVTDGGNLRTVGFYDPAGKWNPDSDHTDPEIAAARCNYLNGGQIGNGHLIEAMRKTLQNIANKQVPRQNIAGPILAELRKAGINVG